MWSLPTLSTPRVPCSPLKCGQSGQGSAFHRSCGFNENQLQWLRGARAALRLQEPRSGAAEAGHISQGPFCSGSRDSCGRSGVGGGAEPASGQVSEQRPRSCGPCAPRAPARRPVLHGSRGASHTSPPGGSAAPCFQSLCPHRKGPNFAGTCTPAPGQGGGPSVAQEEPSSKRQS